MAVIAEKSIYMPHGEEKMTVKIKTERYEANLKARCVHVDKNGEQWKYGIQIIEMDEKTKEQYFQIL